MLVALLGTVGWLLLCAFAAFLLTHRLGSPYAEPAPGGYSDQRLQARDGLQLGAWYQEGESGDAVLILHGDEKSRRQMLPHAPPYQELGASLLLLSMRAHGDSDGRLNDFGWSARQDVLTAVDFLEKKGHQRIFIDGVSMGAAAAVFASKELGDRVDGYILECLYLDLDSAVDRRMHMFLPPGLSSLASWGLEFVSPVCFPDYHKISPRAHMADIPDNVPVLVLGGELDPYVPVTQLESLAAEIPAHSRLVVFPKAGHNELREADQTTYDRLVRDFCQKPPSSAGL